LRQQPSSSAPFPQQLGPFFAFEIGEEIHQRLAIDGEASVEKAVEHGIDSTLSSTDG
jgi:hypothetical protein